MQNVQNLIKNYSTHENQENLNLYGKKQSDDTNVEIIQPWF